jgi:hypothetical protein
MLRPTQENCLWYVAWPGLKRCEHSDMPGLVNALHSLASGTTGFRHRRTTAVTTAPRMVLISSSPNVKLAICFLK